AHGVIVGDDFPVGGCLRNDGDHSGTGLMCLAYLTSRSCSRARERGAAVRPAAPHPRLRNGEGRRMPLRSPGQWGTGLSPVPRCGPAAGGGGCRRRAPTESGATEAHCDELGLLAGLHAHEDATLAVLAGIGERAAHVGRACDLAAGDLEDDVAVLEAVLGC